MKLRNCIITADNNEKQTTNELLDRNRFNIANYYTLTKNKGFVFSEFLGFVPTIHMMSQRISGPKSVVIFWMI